MMNGTGEVRLRNSSDDVCEQHQEFGRGVGGAKGGDQGEHGAVQHVPGAERASMPQGLERVQAAKQRMKERFTALLHHVTTVRLRESFQPLQRNRRAVSTGVRRTALPRTEP